MQGQVAQFLPQRKEPEGSWGLVELKGSLAVTSKSRRLGERWKATLFFFFIRMLFFRPRLNILIFLPILG